MRVVPAWMDADHDTDGVGEARRGRASLTIVMVQTPVTLPLPAGRVDALFPDALTRSLCYGAPA